MGKEPERRDVRKRFDGKAVEMWSYATDYLRRLDTTITFVDGHVEEIKTLPWYDPD
jgi:prepilin-type processing-associated H-X9-DG protein